MLKTVAVSPVRMQCGRAAFSGCPQIVDLNNNELAVESFTSRITGNALAKWQPSSSTCQTEEGNNIFSVPNPALLALSALRPL
jgi:hypothetical protein